jgi:hypothetical protein
MMEAVSSSETSVLTRATRHNIPGDTVLLPEGVQQSMRLPPLTGGFKQIQFPEHCVL